MFINIKENYLFLIKKNNFQYLDYQVKYLEKIYNTLKKYKIAINGMNIGTGKSIIGSTFALSFLEKGYTVFIISNNNFVKEYKKYFNKINVDYTNIQEYLVNNKKSNIVFIEKSYIKWLNYLAKNKKNKNFFIFEDMNAYELHNEKEYIIDKIIYKNYKNISAPNNLYDIKKLVNKNNFFLFNNYINSSTKYENDYKNENLFYLLNNVSDNLIYEYIGIKEIEKYKKEKINNDTKDKKLYNLINLLIEINKKYINTYINTNGIISIDDHIKLNEILVLLENKVNKNNINELIKMIKGKFLIKEIYTYICIIIGKKIGKGKKNNYDKIIENIILYGNYNHNFTILNNFIKNTNVSYNLFYLRNIIIKKNININNINELYKVFNNKKIIEKILKEIDKQELLEYLNNGNNYFLLKKILIEADKNIFGILKKEKLYNVEKIETYIKGTNINLSDKEINTELEKIYLLKNIFQNITNKKIDGLNKVIELLDLYITKNKKNIYTIFLLKELQKIVKIKNKKTLIYLGEKFNSNLIKKELKKYIKNVDILSLEEYIKGNYDSNVFVILKENEIKGLNELYDFDNIFMYLETDIENNIFYKIEQIIGRLNRINSSGIKNIYINLLNISIKGENKYNINKLNTKINRLEEILNNKNKEINNLKIIKNKINTNKVVIKEKLSFEESLRKSLNIIFKNKLKKELFTIIEKKIYNSINILLKNNSFCIYNKNNNFFNNIIKDIEKYLLFIILNI